MHIKTELKGRKVYLVCATLRPETMYGQTNCYVLPTGNYGAFEMKNDEVFICSERAAKNCAFQNLTKENEKVEKNRRFPRNRLNRITLKSPLSFLRKSIRPPHDDHQNGQRNRSSNLRPFRFPRRLRRPQRHLKQRTLKRKIRFNLRTMQLTTRPHHRHPRIRRHGCRQSL